MMLNKLLLLLVFSLAVTAAKVKQHNGAALKPESPSVGKPEAAHAKHKAQDSVIAFSAVVIETLNYLDGNPVIFDKTITNAGGMYFNSTGQFTCSDDDVYVFAWTMGSSGNSSVEGMRVITALHLGTDEAKFGPKVVAGNAPYRGNSASMSAIVQCRTSPLSAISVIIQPWSETNPVVILYPEYPGFSGFKLGPPEGVVAFTTEFSTDTNHFPDDTLVFDAVLQNFGDHYSTLTGMFTCPNSAVYVFMISALSRDNSAPYSVSRLMMDEETVVLGPMTPPGTEQKDGGSATTIVVTKCEQNQQVHVKAEQTSDFPYNSYVAKLTSFTGFRLDHEAQSVAFTAVLGSDVVDPDPEEPMIFDKVVSNFGGAYDAFSGEFVCPDDHLYFFSLTAVSSASIISKIYLDSVPVSTIYGVQNPTGSLTASVIIACQTNSRVSVRAGFILTRRYFADFTSFSGFRLPGQIII